jgi:hypothetical protein
MLALWEKLQESVCEVEGAFGGGVSGLEEGVKNAITQFLESFGDAFWNCGDLVRSGAWSRSLMQRRTVMYISCGLETVIHTSKRTRLEAEWTEGRLDSGSE